MIQFVKRLFGIIDTVDYRELTVNGATILDVRTKEEYANGHIQGSLNVPLLNLNSVNIARLDKNKPVITCCASGMRSASAKTILDSHGFKQVYNGGGWYGLKKRLS